MQVDEQEHLIGFTLTAERLRRFTLYRLEGKSVLESEERVALDEVRDVLGTNGVDARFDRNSRLTLRASGVNPQTYQFRKDGELDWLAIKRFARKVTRRRENSKQYGG